MSKKKAFSGNTMTLKDFHGGSIPSDIPLPSAPGVIVRPADRPSYDRPSSWGNPVSRSDHRLRPSSSGSMRSLDDKTPFLASSANIGRNFDEDERKPLDGALGPRRTVSDESFRTPVVRSEPRGEVGRFTGQHGLGPVVPQVGPVSANSYSARVVEGVHVGVNSRPLSGGGGDSGLYTNAWGVRKEPVAVAETVSSPWTGQNTVSKFAQASAIDQISSGRWQTKPMHQPADIEVIRRSESPDGLYGRENGSYSGVNFASEKEYHEASLVRHVERCLAVDEGFHGGVKEMSDVERVHSPALSDGKEKSSVLYINEGQPAYPDARHGGSDSQLHAEVSERPKLKLLPRTKPLDAPELSTVDHKQPIISSPLETGGNIHGNGTRVKLGVISGDASHVKPQMSSQAANRLVERPKLNLKPRSQPLHHSIGSIQKERVAVFGGARPREMVLKERVVDDVPNSHEEVQSPIRMKSDVLRTETPPVHANTSRHGERTENLPADHRTGRGLERREPRAPVQKPDMQRKNWRNDNWRNRDPEKNHQQERERAPSPETWRKSVEVEQPKPNNSDTSGLRFGKAVSAAELVQAFSRSVPEPKPVDQFSGQRGLPGRSEIPFSRLTGPATTRAQINGY